jgi:hypothetical protein
MLYELKEASQEFREEDKVIRLTCWRRWKVSTKAQWREIRGIGYPRDKRSKLSWGQGSRSLPSGEQILFCLGGGTRFCTARLHMTLTTKMIAARIPLRNSSRGLSTTKCLLCQWRSFTTTYRRLDDKPPKPAPAKSSVLDEAPRSYGKKVTEFTPKPLDRAIGLPNPPRPGENTGIDVRTWKERRDDFVNYDKHLAKREQL